MLESPIGWISGCWSFMEGWLQFISSPAQDKTRRNCIQGSLSLSTLSFLSYTMIGGDTGGIKDGKKNPLSRKVSYTLLPRFPCPSGLLHVIVWKTFQALS